MADLKVPVSRPDLSGNEAAYVADCIERGWISSSGPFGVRFERTFADICQVEHAAATSSGTSALHLALLGLGVGPGDEVIVPSFTFAASVNAVLFCGATPVLIDCEPGGWNLDPAALDSLITERTRAVMAVHLFGLPCRMDEIAEVCSRRGVTLVEDAAEAHGATHGGKPVGGHGVVGCFSFYGNKLVTTGEGGMCVTSDPDLHQRIVELRDHGMSRKRRYWHPVVGYNYRLTDLQAAVGCAQVERIDEVIGRRREIARRYRESLADAELQAPVHDPLAKSIFWQYVIMLPEPAGLAQRDALMEYMAAHGVDSRPFFYPVQNMPPYASLGPDTPNAQSISARGVMLPTFHGMTDADIDCVCDVLKAGLRSVVS